MLLVKPSHAILASTPMIFPLLERAGRICYKTEERITAESAEPFVRKILHSYHHESVIEHACITVLFITDRGVTHELVRHRLVSYSQESTRYCNYGKKRCVTFVVPPWVNIEPGEYTRNDFLSFRGDERDLYWAHSMFDAESAYLRLLDTGWKPQQARSVLPNSLKTEIVATANIREWRHIFKLRTAKDAHPQMVQLMSPLLYELVQRYPVLFADLWSHEVEVAVTGDTQCAAHVWHEQ